MQERLQRGEFPELSMYPDDARLGPAEPAALAYGPRGPA